MIIHITYKTTMSTSEAFMSNIPIRIIETCVMKCDIKALTKAHDDELIDTNDNTLIKVALYHDNRDAIEFAINRGYSILQCDIDTIAYRGYFDLIDKILQTRYDNIDVGTPNRLAHAIPRCIIHYALLYCNVDFVKRMHTNYGPFNTRDLVATMRGFYAINGSNSFHFAKCLIFIATNYPHAIRLFCKFASIYEVSWFQRDMNHIYSLGLLKK